MLLSNVTDIIFPRDSFSVRLADRIVTSSVGMDHMQTLRGSELVVSDILDYITFVSRVRVLMNTYDQPLCMGLSKSRLLYYIRRCTVSQVSGAPLCIVCSCAVFARRRITHPRQLPQLCTP